MRILYVEDDEVQRINLSAMLRGAGHEVVEAETGEDGIALILDPENDFRLLVTDYNLPGTATGGDVAACFRHRWTYRPVIIATGRPDLAESGWAADLDYMYLAKPFRFRALTSMIEAVLLRMSQKMDEIVIG